MVDGCENTVWKGISLVLGPVVQEFGGLGFIVPVCYQSSYGTPVTYFLIFIYLFIYLSSRNLCILDCLYVNSSTERSPIILFQVQPLWSLSQIQAVVNMKPISHFNWNALLSPKCTAKRLEDILHLITL